MLRIGQECGQTWPTDDEVRAILKNDPRAIGTLYGTHYAIRFAHKQMVTIPVDLADAHRDTAQVELREVNPFGLRSTVTSNATLPTQGQAVCSGNGNFHGQRVAYSRTREGQDKCWKGRSARKLNLPNRQ